MIWYDTPMARQPKTHVSVPGTTFIRELEGILEYRLDANGLQILLSPDALIPVVGFMVTYRVGSRNETIGHTGATHLLEHLMFKGSKNFNKEKGNTIWEILESKGALMNATTWNDRTNYFEVIPREHMPLAIAIEADRMRGALIREEDRRSEMPVVMNEYERGENNPMEALDKQIWALAYQAHPYHHSTIGWKSDIEKVSIERLKQFYNDFYWPDNATVSVIGGFTVAEALTLIVKEFGVYPKKEGGYLSVSTEEPKQEGERRATVVRAGNTDMLGIAHKIPAATHKDLPALFMLSLILAEGKTSRLYRVLIDSAKATEVSCTCYQFHDPSLLMTYVTLSPGVSHATVEALVKNEYRKISEKGITAEELKRVKRMLRSSIATLRDGPYAFLSTLNEQIASGDWTRFVTFPKDLAHVTAKQVQKAAEHYLVDSQSTIASFKATASTPKKAAPARTKAKKKQS
jgi:zinc protease